MRNAVVVLLLLGAGLPLWGRQATPTPSAARKARKPTPTPAERPPLDFSGLWELDPTISTGGSKKFGRAMLSVTQKGNTIVISAVGDRPSRILAEEIVADGRPYEKALGPAGKGSVRAQWQEDGSALLIEVTAGTSENPRAAIQQGRWTLSSDGTVWVRETRSISPGRATRSRLVFRKRPAGTPTPGPTS